MDVEAITSFVKTHTKEICITAVVGVALITVIRRRRGKRQKKVYPPNTLVHHQMGRGSCAPSITPFSLKLETYLRRAKVPSLNEHDSITNPSSKGKITWIEYNGEEIADSEFCIQYVNNKFNIDLDKGFSDEDRAAALAIQRMMDEHLYWTLAIQRWVYDPKDGIDLSKKFSFPWSVPPMVRRMITKQSYAQGVGRHTEEEVHHVMHKDLKESSGPTIDRVMEVNACQLSFYSRVKQFFLDKKNGKYGLVLHFVSSMVCGFINIVFSIPVDIVKTGIQNMKTTYGKGGRKARNRRTGREYFGGGRRKVDLAQREEVYIRYRHVRCSGTPGTKMLGILPIIAVPHIKSIPKPPPPPEEPV